MLLLNIHIDAHLDYVQIKVRARNSQVIFNSRFFALAFEIVKRILHYKKIICLHAHTIWCQIIKSKQKTLIYFYQ